MFQTQQFMVACLALILGVGLGVFMSKLIAVPPPAPLPTFEESMVDPSVQEFKNALALFLEVKHQRTLDEVTPTTLMGAFPALVPEDFDGVKTTLGQYDMVQGELVYSNTTVVDEAADVISDAGMQTLRDNIYRRLGFSRDTHIVDVVDALTVSPVVLDSQPRGTATTSEVTTCTLDAKVCPDGTAVGRTGPACEFAACPGEVEPEAESIRCTPEQKAAEACIELYAPVCASVQIQCLTTPCEPIPKTFSNSCFACSEHSVDSYTEGVCAGDVTSE